MPRPDEGLIHAWLDGELDTAEVARVEALVKSDPAWAAAAAEARGLIAASARIVSALDDVPAGVVPRRAQAPAARTAAIATRRTPAWWTLRAAAAVVIVAGSALVLSKSGEITGVVTVLTTAKDEAKRAIVSTDVKEKSAPLGTAGAAKSTPASTPKNKRDQRRENALADTDVGSGYRLTQERRAQQQSLQLRAQVGQQALRGIGAGAPAPADGPPASPVVKQDSISRARLIDSLQKKQPESSFKLEGVVATSAPAAKAAPAVDCYREPSTNAVHRVQRASDSTATPVAPLLEAESLRLRTMTADRSLAPSAVPVLRVKADTLFVPEGSGTIARATKITCPHP